MKGFCIFWSYWVRPLSKKSILLLFNRQLVLENFHFLLEPLVVVLELGNLHGLTNYLLSGLLKPGSQFSLNDVVLQGLCSELIFMCGHHRNGPLP